MMKEKTFEHIETMTEEFADIWRRLESVDVPTRMDLWRLRIQLAMVQQLTVISGSLKVIAEHLEGAEIE